MNKNRENHRNDPQDESTQSLTNSWLTLNPEQRLEKFKSLSRMDAEELFLNLNAQDQAQLLLKSSSPQETRSWIYLLAPDDVADLIQSMGSEYQEEMLALLDPQTKTEVTALLAYAEDAAGGLMSSRFVRLRPDMTADEAISYIRIQAKTHVETIYYAYVLNFEQKLLGVVSFRELLSASPNRKVEEIMKKDVLKIPIEMDQEQIGRIFSQQDLMAIPVVDSSGVMKGIITFDDIATAVQEEATEDIHKIGAVETLEAPYLDISLIKMIQKRGGWLLVLFVGEMFTATAMTFFEDELAKALVLSMFIPLIISSGGNSGAQASTLIIRAIALSEIKAKDWWRVLGREILTGAILGLALGAIGFLRIIFWPQREALYTPHYILVGATVACSVLGVVLWGTISGSMLPFILKKIGFDPASASAPAVATIVDVTGLIIYFTIASAILAGVLL